MKYLVFILTSLFILLSCRSKENENDNIKIGKYLYLTDNGVLHCEQKCVGIILAKDEDGHKVTGMTFVDTLDIIYDENLSYCTRCFNDARYEQVQSMIKRNRKNNTMPEVFSQDCMSENEAEEK